MSQPAEEKKFHRKKGGFRLFGLNRQDFIRYFFGGNASFAILILVLICVFLFLQGKNFLPEYHQSLQIARGSGIDLHDAVDKQYGDIKRFTPGLIRAFSTESTYPGRHYQNLVSTHGSLRQHVEKFTRRDRFILEDLQKKISEAKENTVKSSDAGAEPDPTPDPDFAISREDVNALDAALDSFTAELQSLPPPTSESDEVKAKRMALLRTLFEARKPAKNFIPPAALSKANPTTETHEHPAPTLKNLLSVEEKLLDRIRENAIAALDAVEKNDILEAREISDEEFASIVGDVRSQADNPKARDRDYPLYQEFDAKRAELNATATHAKILQDLYLGLNTSRQPLDELSRFIQDHAVDTKSRSETAASLVKRIRGPYNIYRLREEPKVRADKLAMMLRECSIAEFFHPAARLFYIAALDTIIQEELHTFAAAAAEEAQKKSKAFAVASEKLKTALAVPTNHQALRKAYEAFDNAAQEAQEALLHFKTPAGHYSGFFSGDEGKAAFSTLEGHLEKITAAVPDYREKFRAGSFGQAQLDALAAAAGGNSEIDSSLADQLLKAGRGLREDPRKFAGVLTDLAPGFQLPFPYAELAEPLYEAVKKHGPIVEQLKADIAAAVAKAPTDLQSPYAAGEVAAMRDNLDGFFTEIDAYSAEIAKWKHDHQQTGLGTFGAFVGGSKWTNNSAIQDRYGLLPLFAGSFIISIIAISLAVPIGISAAVYVNQIAGIKQQAFLKPVIEFIGTIPSIVLGFLGITVLAPLLKDVSESPFIDWLPGLPIQSRLNMLTAALLLFFMAIPTIFSLAEDALNNVPGHLRQASLALGASNLQTAFKVVLPAALSGIIAAVLLGFGRVIGETMVVLLVAGNRISLPSTEPAIEWVGMHPATSWALGIGSLCAIVLGIFVRVKKRHLGGPVAVLAGVLTFFPFVAVAFLFLSFATQPSHTMTGIIAQGLGEASQGSTGWQGLFMVGLVLFTISLIINYIAQKVVRSLSIENQIKKKRGPVLKNKPAEPAEAIQARAAV